MKLPFLLFFLFPIFCQAQEASELCVATYNIRYDSPHDPVLWADRKEAVTKLLQKADPDVFGIQEALAHQVDDLKSLLPAYANYGVGRDDGKLLGEQTTIFFKKEKFTLIEKGTFWLSKSPDVVGSKDWDAAITRICSWVHLEEKKSGKSFFAFNAHFDHVGKIARWESMKLIRKKITELPGGTPFILLGDFNFEPDHMPYAVVVDWEIQDAYLVAKKGRTSLPCTFTGFTVKRAKCQRIDYVFASKNLEVQSCVILSENDGTYFPSDHLPVVVEVYLK